MVQTEIEKMAKAANHPNVLQYLDAGRSTYIKPNGEDKEVLYVVFELARYEFADIVLKTGSFSEPLARYFTK